MDITPESRRIRDAVADSIIAEFEAQFCPVSLSVKAIKEAHEACKVERDDDGTMIVPDHKIRLTAAQLALGLRGYVVKQKVEQSGPNGGPIEIADATKLLLDRINSIAARVSAPGSDPGPESK